MIAVCAQARECPHVPTQPRFGATQLSLLVQPLLAGNALYPLRSSVAPAASRSHSGDTISYTHNHTNSKGYFEAMRRRWSLELVLAQRTHQRGLRLS